MEVKGLGFKDKDREDMVWELKDREEGGLSMEQA